MKLRGLIGKGVDRFACLDGVDEISERIYFGKKIFSNEILRVYSGKSSVVKTDVFLEDMGGKLQIVPRIHKLERLTLL